MADPLDEKSDVYVMRDGKMVELSFRELQRECLLGQGHMALFDSIGAAMRLKSEQFNDPNYKPINPGEGLKRFRTIHRIRFQRPR